MKQYKTNWKDQDILVTHWQAVNNNEDYPLMLCLHGLGFDGYLTYNKLGQYFSCLNFNVITFDFPGFGESEIKTDLIELTDLIDLIEYIRSDYSKGQNNQKIILFAHSMAGIMALEYIRTYNNVVGYCSMEGNCLPGGAFLSKKFIRLEGARLQRFFELFIRQVEKNPKQQSMSEESIAALKKTSADTMKLYSDLLVNRVPENLFEEASGILEHKCFIYTPLSPEGTVLAAYYRDKHYELIELKDALHDMLNTSPEQANSAIKNWIEEIVG